LKEVILNLFAFILAGLVQFAQKKLGNEIMMVRPGKYLRVIFLYGGILSLSLPLFGPISWASQYTLRKVAHVMNRPKMASQLPWRQLMNWEYYFNTVAKDRLVSRPSFHPQYFLIPQSEVQMHRPRQQLHQQKELVRDSLIENLVAEKKEGKEFVRWFINPEDSHYHPLLTKYLAQKGLDSKLYNYPRNDFENLELGHKSASRSSFIYPENSNGQAVSFKTSTNRTGGLWYLDKELRSLDIADSMTATEISEQVSERLNLGNIVLAKEPLAMLIKAQDIDQAVVFRSYGDFSQNGNHLLPGFSALHETEGKDLALHNAVDPESTNTANYWRKHYAAPLGRALADFIFTHHLNPTSIHSQQVLIELDPNYLPTGKIVMRDFNDSALLKPLWKEEKDQELVNNWSETKANHLHLLFRIFHGSAVPSWIHEVEGEKDRWVDTYFENFENRFAHLLNISVDQLREKGLVKLDRAKDMKSWDLSHPVFKKWIAAQECFKGREKTSYGLNCEDVLDCFRGENQYSRHRFLCEDVMTALFEKRKLELTGRVSEGTTIPTCTGNPYQKDLVEKLRAPLTNLRNSLYFGW
jgi:hypothetical protein